MSRFLTILAWKRLLRRRAVNYAGRQKLDYLLGRKIPKAEVQ